MRTSTLPPDPVHDGYPGKDYLDEVVTLAASDHRDSYHRLSSLREGAQRPPPFLLFQCQFWHCWHFQALRGFPVFLSVKLMSSINSSVPQVSQTGISPVSSSSSGSAFGFPLRLSMFSRFIASRLAGFCHSG